MSTLTLSLSTVTAAGFDRWDVLVAAGLLTGGAIYATGVGRLWSQAGRWHGFTPARIAAYLGGVATIIVALLSPLDTLSDLLFSAHMSQHELLMLVAAPLLVIGRPIAALLWALPRRARDRVTAGMRAPIPRRAWRIVSDPVVIMLLHAAALWIWHVPWLFEGAMAHAAVHALQHACFFFTAALFWYALAEGRYGRGGYGMAALFVFLTSLHSGLLGTLLTLSGRLWYPIYGVRAPSTGVDALEDQRLAGLLMWIPTGVLFMVLGLGFFAAWMGEAERRAVKRERRPATAPSDVELSLQ
ncbi:MAG TPA: cytochrome c oxidase assembly protein [Polyangia bacterium]|jgi:cytochrome c oxidase assembly factor CtaG|nr:cytochrome c oxidase assembly protein [Polyangia bacterium]